jgi:hypothetical protein
MRYLTFAAPATALPWGEGSLAIIERSSKNWKVSDTEPPLKDNNGADIMTARELHENLKKIYQRHVVHSSRTLDRYYYSSLQKIEERDRSQVVTRYFTERKDVKPWILRVDQLWLWVIDESTYESKPI